MKTKSFTEELVLPEGTSAKYEHNALTVTAKGGTISRVLHVPGIVISVKDGKISIVCKKAGQREKMAFGTMVAHIKNMIAGAGTPYVYKLKICSGHFPMTVACNGQKFEVKNYLGEKIPRVLQIKQGVKVVVDGQSVTVTGNDKELVGTVSSDIEQLVRICGRDRRIFQDGIFIIDKNGKGI